MANPCRGLGPVKRFLFLQGPISPFFPRLGAELRRRGHAVRRINLCLGDRLVWRGAGAMDFRGRLAEWPGFLAAFLDREGITDILLLGEQRLYHRVAAAEAARRGIRVTATDFGYLRPDWIILERDGHNALSHYPRDPDAIRRQAEGAPPIPPRGRFQDAFRRQAIWDIAFHVANMAPWPFPHFETHLLNSPLRNYLGTGVRLAVGPWARRRATALLEGLPPAMPLFVFAMQMEMDYSLRAYSPFPDLDTPLRQTIESFAAHAPAGAHLICKVHPLDTGVKWWGRRIRRMAQAAGVAGRVHTVDGFGLDPILERSRGMVTVNSTAAIAALERGLPVLALGEALFRVPGISHESGLDGFWSTPTIPDPGLTDAFLRGILKHLHVPGGFYDDAALAEAVQCAADRLESGRVGVPEAG